MNTFETLSRDAPGFFDAGTAVALDARKFVGTPSNSRSRRRRN